MEAVARPPRRRESKASHERSYRELSLEEVEACIPIGKERRGTRPLQRVLARQVVPTGVRHWFNVYFSYRTVNRAGRISRVKLSLRKYQRTGEETFAMRQSYNVNSPREAQAVMGFLRASFPQSGL